MISSWVLGVQDWKPQFIQRRANKVALQARPNGQSQTRRVGGIIAVLAHEQKQLAITDPSLTSDRA